MEQRTGAEQGRKRSGESKVHVEAEQELDRRKKALRREVAAVEAGLPAEYKRASDAGIYENITALPEFAAAELIFCFVSMDSEADTRRLIAHALKSGKRVCVPKCVGKGTMTLKEIRSFADLASGAYGILEPKASCLEVELSQISFGLIPCVTCNKRGQRLGHGGGYYDRFLKGVHFPTALVCRERLLVENIPMMIHDVTIPIVITEAGVTRVEAE